MIEKRRNSNLFYVHNKCLLMFHEQSPVLVFQGGIGPLLLSPTEGLPWVIHGS